MKSRIFVLQYNTINLLTYYLLSAWQQTWNTQGLLRDFSEHGNSGRGVVVIGVRRMNEVNGRRARLVLGWVAVFGWVYHLRM